MNKLDVRETEFDLAPSVDTTPWAHPYLAAGNIARFRIFSEGVWDAALNHRGMHPKPLNAAFAVNMAQTMYKCARLATKYGAQSTLYLHPQDLSAISRPEWEEFDGEFPDVLDGPGFLRAFPDLRAKTNLVESPNDGAELLTAYTVGAYSLDAIKLRQRAPTVRHQALLGLRGMYPYFRWAEMLARHDVTYIASSPFPAYASGKPYCIFSVGGDLQYDCGRADDLGRAMRLAFAAARFIFASNPHTLGHCRRFGLTNPIYLPYPMDSDRYCPGEGKARADWVKRFGGDVFVLSTARVDSAVKGQTASMQDTLFRVAEERPSVRFLFLGWGNDADRLKAHAAARGLQDRVIVLPPVGKTRLIDYYRSADVVLDQFVYGYYGATALEAASVGKAVVMMQREEHYAPLYRGDIAPVEQAETLTDVRDTLLGLIDSRDRRLERGRQLRSWLLRNHGEQRTAPLLLALMQFAADAVRLPDDLCNPLEDPLTEEEIAYHQACRQVA